MTLEQKTLNRVAVDNKTHISFDMTAIKEVIGHVASLTSMGVERYNDHVRFVFCVLSEEDKDVINYKLTQAQWSTDSYRVAIVTTSKFKFC